MTVTVSNIIPAKQAENTQTTQYIASDVKTIIDKFTITNTSANTVAFSANLVVDGGTAGDDNLLIDARALAPNETYNAPELVGHLLDVGDFISTLAGASSSLTIRATGRIIT